MAVGLSKVYGSGQAAVTALDDVSVDFARGQLTAIMDRPALTVRENITLPVDHR